ncbi:hypothetical protein BC830DRAFT_1169778 [Chytriomyces sp. MP71]|nr:hypothetical protein BC830DRAFT_1169778 [Chytriomyces sp. MP71]
MEYVQDDDKAVKDFGVKLAINICNKLRAEKGFHFYMNLEKSVRLILEGLKFVAPLEVAKPLPWNPVESLPIWRCIAHATNSHSLITTSMKPFVPYFGKTATAAMFCAPSHGMSFQMDARPAIPSQAEEALKVWGEPVKVDDIHKLFVDFSAAETFKGFLTINSQPAINGRMSIDATFRWGPKGGFVYQKANVEFFVAPEALEALLNDLDTFVSYYAVNRKGDIRTNVVSSGPNAVTWGVFPGQEIVQLNIVERESFMAWKDEAFGLWKEWARVYPSKIASASLIEGIANNWFLVNVVYNHFKSGSAIFELFETLSVEE